MDRTGPCGLHQRQRVRRLCISDVTTFHSDRLLATWEIQVRTTKAGTHVYTWVPEGLQERIRERAPRVGPLIFGVHDTKDTKVITDVWRRKLKKLWNLCGPWAVTRTRTGSATTDSAADCMFRETPGYRFQCSMKVRNENGGRYNCKKSGKRY